jgi:hypothetical protein
MNRKFVLLKRLHEISVICPIPWFQAEGRGCNNAESHTGQKYGRITMTDNAPRLTISISKEKHGDDEMVGRLEESWQVNHGPKAVWINSSLETKTPRMRVSLRSRFG